MTGYVFKSAALKAQNEKSGQKEADARVTLAKIGVTYESTKQTTEELDGQRGTNRAIRQRDLASLAGTMLNVEQYQSGGSGSFEQAVIADLLELKRQLLALSTKKGRG